MDEVTVLAEIKSGGVGAEAMDVRWEGAPLMLEERLRVFIDQRWAVYLEEAKALGQMLFDGRLARLVTVTVYGDRVHLTLGPTDYKSLAVSSLRDRAWFKVHAPGVSVGALGNSVLLTHRGRGLLGIRSAKVIGYTGRAHLIGGGLEALDEGKYAASGAGIAEHLRAEVGEELGLVADELSGEPRLVAVVRDESMDKPELIWRWELDEDIENLAKHGDGKEHVGWAMVKQEAVGEELWRQMTPVARHAWKCWSRQGRSG